MRTVTIVVAMLDIAAWLLVAVVALLLGSDAATRGVVGDAPLAVTALILATAVPALALALADSVPRTALMLALAFPPVLAMTVAAWA